MTIGAVEVKKLRDSTGAGMMDAKKALQESDGDFDKAVKYLREKGLSDSKKREGKDANEGVIGHYIHKQQGRAVSGVLVELACETDFVAKSEDFISVAQQIAMHIAAMKPIAVNLDEISDSTIENEKEIYINQAKSEGKNPKIIDKYVEGKISAYFKENILLEQVFCNPEFYEGTVGNMIEEMSGRLGEKIYIKNFSRVEIGKK